MATANDVAAAFLKELGAPTSGPIVKAVIAWMRKESGSTPRGGNPWNIGAAAGREIAAHGGPKPIGTRTITLKDGSKRFFAIYASNVEGARAAALLLKGAGHDWRHYDGIVAAARKGDPAAFFLALSKSAWSEDRYGGPRVALDISKPGSLANIYYHLGGDAGKLILPNDTSGASDGGKTVHLPFGKLIRAFQGAAGKTVTDGILTAWANAIADNPTYVTAATGSSALLTGDAWNQFREQVKAAAIDYKGKPVDTLPEYIDVHLTASATVASTAQGPLESIAGFIGAILDPGHWARFLALIVGAGLVAYGGIAVLRASGPRTPIA